MENQLSKYIGRELKGAIDSLQVKKGTTKDGADYSYISLKFINGYENRIFLKSDAQFAFSNAFDLVQVQQTIDNNF